MILSYKTPLGFFANIFYEKEKIVFINLSFKQLSNSILKECFLDDYFLFKRDITINDLFFFKENESFYKAFKEKVKFGNTIYYKKLGQIFEIHPRKIGYLMKKNPFPIVIPCHRVISEKGIGGYSFGIDIKKKLLEFENIKT